MLYDFFELTILFHPHVMLVSFQIDISKLDFNTPLFGPVSSSTKTSSDLKTTSGLPSTDYQNDASYKYTPPKRKVKEEEDEREEEDKSDDDSDSGSATGSGSGSNNSRLVSVKGSNLCPFIAFSNIVNLRVIICAH